MERRLSADGSIRLYVLANDEGTREALRAAGRSAGLPTDERGVSEPAPVALPAIVVVDWQRAPVAARSVCAAWRRRGRGVWVISIAPRWSDAALEAASVSDAVLLSPLRASDVESALATALRALHDTPASTGIPMTTKAENRSRPEMAVA